MNGTSQGREYLYSVIWIPILDPDSRYRPTKTICPVSKGREHTPSLSVCLYGLSVCDPACLLGFRACRSTSTTGHAKNVPNPTSCWDTHHVLSVTIPTHRDFITDSAFLYAFSHYLLHLLQLTLELP